MQSLKQTCFDIWNSKEIRRGVQSSFHSLFIRYIGIENNQEYNDILKTFDTKIEENKDISILFTNEIPFPQNFQLLTDVSNGLQTIDVLNLKDDDIILFQNNTLNNIFIESLSYIINLAISNEHFINESTRNSFITKLVLWTYEYTKNIKFDTDKNPKCIYYGNITRHEVYFLLLLYHMTFDVIYINSLKDEYFNEIDVDKLSTLQSYSLIQPLETWQSRIDNGKVIDYNESFLYQMQNQIDTELYGNGVYKPWQLRAYSTIPITKQCTIIDLENNINEPAKVRDGFKVDSVVHIPCLFMKIDGIYQEQTTYNQLISKCISSNLVEIITKFDFIESYQETDKYQLSFSQLNDGTFQLDELKKLSFYKYNIYKTEVQDLILNKINETILTLNLTKEDKFTYVIQLLNLNPKFIRLIDNFDFPNEIPKVIVFLERETVLTKDIMYILLFLHQIGIDIIIFDPSGLTNIDIVINKNMISNIRLDYMKYDMTFEETKKKQKKSFFEKLWKG